MDEPQKSEQVPDSVFVGQETEEELVEDDGTEILVDEFFPNLIRQ